MSVASDKKSIDAWREYLAWRRYGEQPASAFTAAQRLKFALTSVGARMFMRLMTDTCCWSVDGYPLLSELGKRQFVFVTWHNRALAFTSLLERFARRNPDYVVKGIISASADGEILARLVRENGGGVLRGSSSRDAVKALRGAVDEARAGSDIFTVGDGPRGPRYKLKPGAIMLAKATGLPILPISWTSTRTLQLHRAWDQLMIPLPGSSLKLRFGEPLHVPQDADTRAVARLRREVENRLDALTQWADPATRITVQFPTPKKGEVLKRRAPVELEGRHV